MSDNNTPNSTVVAFLDPIKAQYVESGTFVAGEEQCIEYGLNAKSDVLIITKVHFLSLVSQLKATTRAAYTLRNMVSTLETIDCDERSLARDEKRSAHVHTRELSQATEVLNACAEAGIQ